MSKRNFRDGVPLRLASRGLRPYQGRGSYRGRSARPSQIQRKSGSAATTGHKGWFDRMATLTTALTAIIALILSVINWVQLGRRPEMIMTMPGVIKISQSPRGAEITVQPTFTVGRKADVSSVVSQVRLEIASAQAAAPDIRDFRWNEIGTFIVDEKTGQIIYRFLGEPTPFVVTPEEPQHSYLTFLSERLLSAGRWNGRIIAERPGRDALTSDLCFELTVSDVAELAELKNDYFVFRNLSQAGRDSENVAECYRRT